MVWSPAQPPSHEARLSARAEGRRRWWRSGLRHQPQRDEECSCELTVSATLDGWDQWREDELLQRLPGHRQRRRRRRRRRRRLAWSGPRGRSVFRFKQKPFFDSSGQYCFESFDLVVRF